VKQQVHHRARRTSPRGIAITIERVLANIEVKGAQIKRAKVENLLENPLEIIGS
jgi:hypothetical protein